MDQKVNTTPPEIVRRHSTWNSRGRPFQVDFVHPRLPWWYLTGHSKGALVHCRHTPSYESVLGGIIITFYLGNRFVVSYRVPHACLFDHHLPQVNEIAPIACLAHYLFMYQFSNARPICEWTYVLVGDSHAVENVFPYSAWSLWDFPRERERGNARMQNGER